MLDDRVRDVPACSRLGVRIEHVLAESIGHDTCEPSPRSCITVAAKSSSSSYSASFKQPSSDGVDASLELVGSNTLRDTLRATRVHGVTCFTGMLSNQWTIPDFYPIDFIPNGVRLTAYGAPESDLPADVLQSLLDQVAGVSSCRLITSTGSTRSAPPTPTWRPAAPPESSSYSCSTDAHSEKVVPSLSNEGGQTAAAGVGGWHPNSALAAPKRMIESSTPRSAEHCPRALLSLCDEHVAADDERPAPRG
jgi:hypothetical protein